MGQVRELGADKRCHVADGSFPTREEFEYTDTNRVGECSEQIGLELGQRSIHRLIDRFAHPERLPGPPADPVDRSRAGATWGVFNHYVV